MAVTLRTVCKKKVGFSEGKLCFNLENYLFHNHSEKVHF